LHQSYSCCGCISNDDEQLKDSSCCMPVQKLSMALMLWLDW
jgi:hypothetical protein